MTLEELTSAVVLQPEIARLGRTVLVDGRPVTVPYPDEDKRAAIVANVPLVIAEMLNSYDFDFAVKENDFTGGTTANTATYRLEGDDQDCRDIIAIKYDVNEYDLDYLDKREYDRKYSGVERPSTVSAWMFVKREHDFPLIQLVGAPTVSGKRIRYRYYTKALSIDAFPEQAVFVLKYGVVAALVPNFRPVFIDALTKYVNRQPQGKGDDSPALIAKPLQAYYSHLNSLHGYGT